MYKPIEVSIILPTYNEAGNIVLLIDQIHTILKRRSFEIIVVDDDSPDRTGDIVKGRFKNDRWVAAYIRTEDKGLARAILYGIKKAKGKYIIVMDTDFNHNPAVILQLLRYKESYDMIIGSRYIQGGGMEDRLRFVLSFLYNIVIRNVLHLSTHDNLSGFFLIHTKHLKKFDADAIFIGYGDYFIRLLTKAHDMHLRIKEIPVFYEKRKAGESKSKFIDIFIDYTKTVVDIIRKE